MFGRLRVICTICQDRPHWRRHLQTAMIERWTSVPQAPCGAAESKNNVRSRPDRARSRVRHIEWYPCRRCSRLRVRRGRFRTGRGRAPLFGLRFLSPGRGVPMGSWSTASLKFGNTWTVQVSRLGVPRRAHATPAPRETSHPPLVGKFGLSPGQSFPTDPPLVARSAAEPRLLYGRSHVLARSPMVARLPRLGGPRTAT